MAALTQQQWYEKIVSWVPSWWWKQKDAIVYGPAVFWGFAKIFSQIDTSLDEHFAETFILQAAGNFLDEHGDERTTPRLTDEEDGPYALRIQRILSTTDKTSIKEIVDALLRVGECEIREGFQDLAFCDREAYCNRDAILFDHYYNAFMILVEKQLLDPALFADRTNFADRGEYMSGDAALQATYQSIVEAVNRAKALGVGYMIVERD